MISLMLRLLTITALSSSLLFSAESSAVLDKKVVSFLEKAISPNESYKFDKIVILKKDDLKDMKDWKVYFVRIDLFLIKQQDKKISVNDIVFTNGKILSKDFIDLSSGKSIKSTLSLDMDVSAYNKEHLIAGNIDAPNKIVVFSDPLCPFCMDFVPEVINDVEKNPETFALFYYHFPLTIHPAAPTLVKAMMVAEEKGEKSVIKKVYNEIFDAKTTDEKIILDAFNAALKTSVTVAEINQPSILKKLKADEEFANNLMVNGTPIVYLNGKKDESKRMYRNFIKEAK